MYNVVSFSGGKDSTAMLLMMIDKNLPIDEIIFCDTGMEHDELYQHVDKVEKYTGRKITRLKSEKSFEYYLYGHCHGGLRGYGWSTMHCRWCTLFLKTRPISKHLKGKKDIVSFIGIASDEPKRVREKDGKRYPLYEWGVTESEALQYCYDNGFDFGWLYENFKRLGCYCCPLQGKKDLYALFKHYPKKWESLLQMEQDMVKNIVWKDNGKGPIKFYSNMKSVAELDKEFSIRKINEESQINLFSS